MRATAVAVFVGAVLVASTTPRDAHALINQGYCSSAQLPACVNGSCASGQTCVAGRCNCVNNSGCPSGLTCGQGSCNYSNNNNSSGALSGQWAKLDPTDCPGGQATFPDGSLAPCVLNLNPVYIKPEIVPIFWDANSYWENPGPGNTTRGQELGLFQYMVNSAYFGALNQYGVSPPRLAPVAPIDSSPELPLSDYISTWGNQPNNGQSACANTNDPFTGTTGCGTYYAMFEAINAIALGIVPPPLGADMLYYVMVPPGIGNGGGYGWGTCPYYDPGTHYQHSCGAYDNKGLTFRFAYDSANDTYGRSHEIVEALTGGPGNAPLVKQNVGLNGSSSATGVSDLCGCGPPGNAGPDSEQQDNQWLAGYYSQVDGACVVPEGWPDLFYWDAHDGWQLYLNATIQEYATSGPNIVITDTNDNLYSVTFPFIWKTIGQPPTQPSQLAIKGDATHPEILLLANDSSNIWMENSFGSNSWTSLGLVDLASNVASGIVSGVDALATDAAGQPYYYNGIYFTNFGTKADQFIGTGQNTDDVFSVNWDHSGIKYAQPSVGQWYVSANGTTTQLFGNPTSDLIASTDNYFNIWTSENGGSWLEQTNNIGDSLALLGGGTGGGPYTLWWLKNDRSQQSFDSPPNKTWGNWSTNLSGGVISRIIGSTDFYYPIVFAFGCASYQYSTATCVTYCLSSGQACNNSKQCCNGTCTSSGTCN